MLSLFGDVLRSVTVTVAHVARKPRVWKVDQSSGQFLEAVASAEVQQRRTVV